MHFKFAYYLFDWIKYSTGKINSYTTTTACQYTDITTCSNNESAVILVHAQIVILYAVMYCHLITSHQWRTYVLIIKGAHYEPSLLSIFLRHCQSLCTTNCLLIRISFDTGKLKPLLGRVISMQDIFRWIKYRILKCYYSEFFDPFFIGFFESTHSPDIFAANRNEIGLF
jgi:hypothetical protein